MSYLYVCEQGATIGITENRFQVKYKDGMVKSIPAETLEVIEVFGKIQITTQCMTECLKRGVNILFYSTQGAYFGRLISTNHMNVQRQRIQAKVTEDEQFRLNFSKRIINAKNRNQIGILRRYARNRENDIQRAVIEMQNMYRKLETAQHIEQVMGYEGTAAKIYFRELGKLIDPAFAFTGRNRRPPRDPFNSLISLGYSIILNELYGKIEGKGLNPYFGVMHSDREKHPTLASDLMEEWRAVLIDSIALGMLNGHELVREDFYSGTDQPGVFLEKEGFKKYVQKLETKFRAESRYLTYIDYSVSFRRAMDLQINQFIRAIEEQDVQQYTPVMIRLEAHMENFFWNTEESHNVKKLYVLIIYDIVDNKKRLAFSKKLNGYGFRVQKSAFEAMITENLYRKLIDEISKLIDKELDSVRVYKIRGSGEVNLFGVSSAIADEEVIFI